MRRATLNIVFHFVVVTVWLCPSIHLLLFSFIPRTSTLLFVFHLIICHFILSIPFILLLVPSVCSSPSSSCRPWAYFPSPLPQICAFVCLLSRGTTLTDAKCSRCTQEAKRQMSVTFEDVGGGGEMMLTLTLKRCTMKRFSLDSSASGFGLAGSLLTTWVTISFSQW
jgi:hypothetical protein